MSKKKIKKKNRRKKPVLKTKKKVSVKKPMRNKRAAKKAVKFLSLKKIVAQEKLTLPPLKLARPIQQEKTEPLVKKTIPPVNTTKNYISRHIVDLRKIQAEKSQAKDENEKYIYEITEEVLGNIVNKKRRSSKQIEATVSNNKNEAENIPNIILSKPKVKNNWIKKSRPKLALPSINLPSGTLNLPLYWAKTTLSFIAICLILISPLFAFDQYQTLQGKKATVLGKTASALTHLSLSGEAASAHDLYYTQFELQAASENFTAAEKELQDINLLVQGLLKLTPKINDQYNSATKLLDAGEKLSKSAATLSATLENFNLLENPAESINLTNKLSALKDNLNLILPDLKTAESDLSEINVEDIPLDYRNKIQALQKLLPDIESNVGYFINYSDLALQILGQDSLKRYLLLFQNNNELRPTGGFIGSYALLDLNKGNIKKISIPGGGPYDLKAGLKVNIAAPRPLRILNQRWEFQDANWFADLPTSADKLMWFYEKSGGPTVDGLIFINASFVENLLKITGPIDMPEYGKSITSDNFINEIQQSVEFEYDKTVNRPKQIIADLAPKLIDKLLHSDKNTLINILDLVFNSLNEKDIQLYFSNFSLEKFILKNNWGGQIKKTDGDYLNIVSTNIAGEKTDAKINQEVDLKVNIGNDGTITNTLTLTKTHTGQKDEALYGVPNVDYLRIYTPKGSEFVSASGFDQMESELFENIDPKIYKADEELVSIANTKRVEPITQTEIYFEGDKTVFANWLKVEPGQTKTITLSYRLPFKINLYDLNKENNSNILEILKAQINNSFDDTNNLEKYSLLLQKQSGRNYKINVTINFPENFETNMIYPENMLKKQKSYFFSEILNTDKLLAIIFNQL